MRSLLNKIHKIKLGAVKPKGTLTEGPAERRDSDAGNPIPLPMPALVAIPAAAGRFAVRMAFTTGAGHP